MHIFLNAFEHVVLDEVTCDRFDLTFDLILLPIYDHFSLRDLVLNDIHVVVKHLQALVHEFNGRHRLPIISDHSIGHSHPIH